MGCPGFALLFGHPLLCYGIAGSKQLGVGGISTRQGGSSSVVSPQEACPIFTKQCHLFLGLLGTPGKIKSGRASGALCGHAGGRCQISMQNKTCLFSTSCMFSLAFNSTPKFNVVFVFMPLTTLFLGTSCQTISPRFPFPLLACRDESMQGAADGTVQHMLLRAHSELSLRVQCTLALPGSVDRGLWLHFLIYLESPAI